MERNNTYGELINNKFSELLPADKDSTWKDMKVILDKEMPDRRKRWLIWFGTKVLIILVILFTLFAAASHIGFNPNRNKEQGAGPVKKIENKSAQQELHNDIEKKEATSSISITTEKAEAIVPKKKTTRTYAANSAKTKANKVPELAITKDDTSETASREIVIVTKPVKASMETTATAPESEAVVERRRAF